MEEQHVLHAGQLHVIFFAAFVLPMEGQQVIFFLQKAGGSFLHIGELYVFLFV